MIVSLLNLRWCSSKQNVLLYAMPYSWIFKANINIQDVDLVAQVKFFIKSKLIIDMAK